MASTTSSPLSCPHFPLLPNPSHADPQATYTRIPALGLGTWKSQTGGEVKVAVKAAIAHGYRHIDCAHAYLNEHEVGEAIKESISEGVIKSRDELFITSKVFNCFHRKENVEKALLWSLKKLGVEYLDLYLIHWPIDFAYKWEDGAQSLDLNDASKLFPKITGLSSAENNPSGDPGLVGRMQLDEVDKMETWRELQRIVLETGMVKNIGLSNFNIAQIDSIISHPDTEVLPSVLQVECHPYLSQQKLKQYCDSKKIVLTAYSPLGGSTNDRPEDVPSPLRDETIVQIGSKYLKNAGQVCLRFLIQKGVVAIPKSVKEERIAGNGAGVLDFELSEEDMKAIEGLNREWRSCVPSIKDPLNGDMIVVRDLAHKDFPFEEFKK